MTFKDIAMKAAQLGASFEIIRSDNNIFPTSFRIEYTDESGRQLSLVSSWDNEGKLAAKKTLEDLEELLDTLSFLGGGEDDSED